MIDIWESHEHYQTTSNFEIRTVVGALTYTLTKSIFFITCVLKQITEVRPTGEKTPFAAH